MRSLVKVLDGPSFGTLLVGAIALIVLENTMHQGWMHIAPFLAASAYWGLFHKMG